MSGADYFCEQLTLFDRCDCPLGGAQPRFFVWENVPGAFTSGKFKGADFRCVLEEIGQTEIPMPPDNKWSNSGMVECEKCVIEWRVLDAQYWGVPQRRRRIFLVADFATTERCRREILFECKSVPGNSAESKREEQSFATEIGRGTDHSICLQERAGKLGGGKGLLLTNERTGALSTSMKQNVLPAMGDDVIPMYSIDHNNSVKFGTSVNALVASEYKDATRIVEGCEEGEGCALNKVETTSRVRRLTPIECERLQGLPDNYTLIDDKSCSDSARYKAIGNGMAQPCADYVIKRIVEVSS